MSMNICHIVERDSGGGAFRAAYRLHSSLNKTGTNSIMLVGDKRRRDPSIQQVQLRYDAKNRIRRRYRNFLHHRRTQRFKRTRSPHLELFTFADGLHGDALIEALPHADVYNLHWLRHLLDFRTFFSSERTQKPLIWRLPDMNAMTGGCHYTLGCDRFTSECGACPQLGSTTRKDASWTNFHIKKAALVNRDPRLTKIVAISNWQSVQAQRSSLLSSFDILCIPPAIETDDFQPRNPRVGRELLGISDDRPVLLCLADSVANYRKGIDLAVAAIETIRFRCRPTLVLVGRSADVLEVNYEPIVRLGPINSDRILSFVYSAADGFLMPSRAEAFGQVAIESMACGTPVIGFDVGGISDAVRPGHTGLLAPPEDVAGLRDAIATLLEDDELRARLGAEAREVAVREYGMELMARRYLAVYEELVEAAARRSHTPRPGTRPRA